MKYQKKNVYYTCRANITVDSVMKMKKMNYPQVYLEECKYKIKKIEMSKFINTNLESESQSESGSGIESDTESKPKSKLKSDSE